MAWVRRCPQSVAELDLTSLERTPLWLHLMQNMQCPELLLLQYDA